MNAHELMTEFLRYVEVHLGGVVESTATSKNYIGMSSWAEATVVVEGTQIAVTLESGQI